MVFTNHGATLGRPRVEAMAEAEAKDNPMKFFVDTADVKDIRDLAETGLLDGVTTNPSLIAKSGGDFKATIKEICKIVEGPVSAEVAATEAAKMIEEGQTLAKIAGNVVVKVPGTASRPVAPSPSRAFQST
jgi:TalC/MipB family fructose-6-phosphate aldolase